MLRGVGEEWTVDGVLDAIKCDHGYSRSSPAVLAFVSALTELEHDERRALLRFVTGSPRLPPGGLAALRPRLTIVKKHAHMQAQGASSMWCLFPLPEEFKQQLL